MATIAWPLIILIIVLFVLIFIASAFILVRFQHPDEARRVWIPKVVFVVGLAAAFMNVLLLPLDVANRNSGSTLDMLLLLYIVYALVLFMALMVIPFSLFFYEAEKAENNRITDQVYTGVCYTIGALCIFALICGLMYTYLGETRISTRALTARLIRPTVLANNPCQMCTASGTFMKIRVSILVYMVSLLAFIGLIMMLCYGGVGVVNLPANLINDFVTRPEKITLDEYMRKKTELATRCAKLLQMSEEMSTKARSKGGKRGWSDRRKFNRFKKDVLQLEKEFRRNNESYKASTHPWYYYIKLVLGVLCIGLGVLWVLHCIFFLILPDLFSNPFLNTMFSGLDNAFQLFGVAAYCLFAFFLMWAVIKGQIVIGLRILIVSIHPMTVGETLISSLLFNVMMILISSIAVAQFCATAFATYGHSTEVSSIMRTQISNLRVTSLFFKNTAWFFVVIVGLTTGWYCMCGVRPNKKKKPEDDD